MKRVQEDSQSAACISPSPQAEGHTVQRKEERQDTGQGLLDAGMKTQGWPEAETSCCCRSKFGSEEGSLDTTTQDTAPESPPLSLSWP